MAKVKSLYSKGQGNARATLEACAATGLPYTVIETNYTTEIMSDFCNVYFMQDEISKRTFAAANKIKKDIAKTGLTPPEFSNNENFYFEFAPKDILLKNRAFVFNVDIKSAYAYALFNNGLISKKTFQYMKRLNKRERLACVGMLASAKDYYDCIGNETLNFSHVRKDTKDWFFFACYAINKLMFEIRQEIGPDFLFYWVDGIFFKGYNNFSKITDILSRYGYKYSEDICTDFHYNNDNEAETLRYKKGDGTQKTLSLPKKNSELQDFILKLVGLKK